MDRHQNWPIKKFHLDIFGGSVRSSFSGMDIITADVPKTLMISQKKELINFYFSVCEMFCVCVISKITFEIPHKTSYQ